ncbi:MAG: hypothetical protein OXQ32_03250, partial [bacterium]|nr:hypothetical protein [bacterium]
QLTHDGGASPQWSPDGTRIAYTGNPNEDSNFQVFVMDADGSNQRQLTHDGGASPQWSPDGTSIAYERHEDYVWEVFVMDVDGSNQRQLTYQGGESPVWSPDGACMAYQNEAGVFLRRADGGDEPQLIFHHGESPAWSADGTRLAAGGKHGTAVVVVDANVSIKQHTHTQRDSHSSLSPDGTRIVFNRHMDGDFQIFVMDIDGANLKQITHRGGTVPRWSPDGTRIAFTRTTPQLWINQGNLVKSLDENIFVMGADGANLQQVTHGGGSNPVWSPDGTRIAYESIGSIDQSFFTTIFTVNADGTNPEQLGSMPALARKPVWSPDGSKIAYQTDASDITVDGDGIFVMNADGTDAVQITDESDSGPFWSPDSTRVAYSREGEGVFVSDANGANTIQLTHDEESLDFWYQNVISWSPDGGKIAYARSTGFNKGGIVVMNADGTQQTQLTNLAETDPTWSPDGTRIVFNRHRQNSLGTRVINPDGTDERQLTNGPRAAGDGVWSLDGALIVSADMDGVYVVNVEEAQLRYLTHPVYWPLPWRWDDRGRLFPSPDGTHIAYSRSGGRTFVMDADGTNHHQPLEEDSYNPEWSPDSTRIAYLDRWGDALFTVNADGTNHQLVTTCTGGGCAGPSWSPDGKRIAIKVDPPSAIYVINADGTDPYQVAPDIDTGPFWSPTDSKIAFTKSDLGIFVINADGSNEQQLTPDSSTHLLWSPDGTAIAFTRTDGGIVTINVDGTNQTTVDQHGDHPSWSPDGTRIAYARYFDYPEYSEGIFITDRDGTHTKQITAGGREPFWAKTND